MAAGRCCATIICGGALLALIATLPTRAEAQAAGGVLQYSGVSIQGGDPPPMKQPPPAGFQHVNWPGFRASRGGAPTEVFLQLSGPVQYRLKQRGRMVEVVLERAKVYLRNNLRPLITRDFPRQPVDSVRLRELRGGRLALEIRLRAAAKAEAALKTVGQYTYLVVSLPG